MKAIRALTIILTLILLTYLFTFIEKIGLHGDEAYFGLDAYDISINGFNRLSGMYPHNGRLQSLINLLAFTIWKTDVTALRIGGVISNAFALLLTLNILKTYWKQKAVLVFLMLFLQSAFLMCYSKIAWEVCSFNFLFISLAFLGLHLLRKKHSVHFGGLVFLTSVLLGTYNHFIFSSILLSVTLAIFIWIILEHPKPTHFLLRFLSLSVLASINVLWLFVALHFFQSQIWDTLKFFSVLVPVLIIVLEVYFYSYTLNGINKLWHYLAGLKTGMFLKIAFIASTMVIFGAFQFLNFYDTLSSEKIFLRVFSFELPQWASWILKVNGMVILGAVFWIMASEVYRRKVSFYSYFLAAYLLTLPIIVQGYSIRYYHIITLLVFLYLSLNWQKFPRLIFIGVVSSLGLSAILNQSLLWSFNFQENRLVKAQHFSIGNDNIETSAHFLPFSPVVEFSLKNNLGSIVTQDEYFIGRNFRFYKHVYPQLQSNKNVARIEYNYETLGSGFKMELVEEN